jgi:hypothetical protein
MVDNGDPGQLTRIEELLEDNLHLAKENNHLLKSIRNGNRVAFWAKVVLWTVVLVLPFFFLGPLLRYLSPLTGGAIPVGGTSLFGLPSSEQLQKAVQQYKAQYQGQK